MDLGVWEGFEAGLALVNVTQIFRKDAREKAFCMNTATRGHVIWSVDQAMNGQSTQDGRLRN